MAGDKKQGGQDDFDDEEIDEILAGADSLFVGLVGHFDDWLAQSADKDLMAIENAVLRFGAVTTLILMHDAIEDSENAGTGLSREELAKEWIADMSRAFAEMLMNQELITASAGLIDKPDLRLHFDRAFRRRMFTG